MIHAAKFLILALAVCAGTFTHGALADTPKPEKKTVTVALGGRNLIAYIALTIADRRGYFKEQGLGVDFVDFPGGSKALEAFIGGDADFSAGGYEHSLYLQMKGVQITAIAALNDSFGAVIGLTRKHADAYHSPRDLKGLTFGVTAPGSSSAVALQLLLSKGGLAPDSVSVIGVGGAAGAVAAVRSGTIDGISNFDPVMTKLIHDGDIVPIVDTRTEKGLEYLYGGPYAASVTYTTPRMISQYPQTVAAYVTAVVDALRWLRTASVDDIAAAVPSSFHGSDPELYKAALTADRNAFSQDGIVTLEAAKNTYRILSTFDAALRKANIDFGSTFDDRFARTAAQR